MSVFGVFLVRIFPYLSWIRRDAPYLSAFSLNAGKYGPELLRIGTLFTRWELKLFLPIRFHRLSSFKLRTFQFCLTLCAEQSMKYHRNISSQWLNSTYYSNKRSLPPSLMKTWIRETLKIIKIYQEIHAFSIMRVITCFD